MNTDYLRQRRKEEIVMQACDWFESRRPLVDTHAEHLKQFQVNCTDEREIKLAKAVAEFLSHEH